MSKEQLLITLPKRGLRVIPPPEVSQKMIEARKGNIVRFSEEDKYRLRKLIDCSILARRHPTPDAGREYMESVDYDWRNELLGMAGEMAATVVEEWSEINQEQPLAILLYGSVAKGLVKRPDHPDPSNIDLAVMGCITEEERLMLFDRIRPMRTCIQERILAHAEDINSPEANPGNAGVIVQHIDKVTKENFSGAKAYIAAGAIPLHDPAYLWRSIEQEAIRSALNKEGQITQISVGSAK